LNRVIPGSLEEAVDHLWTQILRFYFPVTTKPPYKRRAPSLICLPGEPEERSSNIFFVSTLKIQVGQVILTESGIHRFPANWYKKAALITKARPSYDEAVLYLNRILYDCVPSSHPL
jgi:hypothetical protein